AEGRKAIAAAGLVVCLEATAETILARIEGGAAEPERPLLGDASLERIRRLKSQRAALYAMADFTVHTDGMEAPEVAQRIARFYDEEGARAFSRPGRVEQFGQTPAGLPPILDTPGAAAIV